MSGLRGVVWDCDGTLVDSEPIALVQWEIVLDRHGYKATAGDWSTIVGRPFDAFYDYFSERIELPPQDVFMEEYVELLFPILRSELRAFDDAVAAVRLLALAPSADGGGLFESSGALGADARRDRSRAGCFAPR